MLKVDKVCCDIIKGDRLQVLLQKSSRFIYKGDFEEIQEEEENSLVGFSSKKDNILNKKFKSIGINEK